MGDNRMNGLAPCSEHNILNLVLIYRVFALPDNVYNKIWGGKRK